MPLDTVSVSAVLKEKAASVFSIAADATAASAVAEMNRHRIGSVMVKEGGQYVGIFTERDVLTRIVSDQRDAGATPVSEVMTRDYRRITAKTSVEEAMQMMTDYRVRHLPVFDGDGLLGLLSIGDVTRWLLKVNQMEAETLRQYLFSEYPG